MVFIKADMLRALKKEPSEMVKVALITFFLWSGTGAVTPILSLYLSAYLNFSLSQIGIILSLSALSAIVAPFIVSFIADRLIPSERLFSICLFTAAFILLILRQTAGFYSFVAVYLCYILMIGSIPPLNNTIIFHHIRDPKKNYGRVRVFGTLGWIAVAWVFSFLWLRNAGGELRAQRLPGAFILAAAAFTLTGLLSFLLPSSGKGAGKTKTMPWSSFRMITRPEMIILVLAAFIMLVTDKFYFFGSSLFLRQSGFSESKILPLLSLGQFSEIPAMIFLGYFVGKLGIKKTMLVGISCNILRYLLFLLSKNSPALIPAGIFFHGFSYTFFFSTTAVFLDSCTGTKTRAATHQVFAMMTTGFAALAGNLLAGFSAQALTAAGTKTINFSGFWSISLALCTLSLLILLFFFKKEPARIIDEAAESHLEHE